MADEKKTGEGGLGDLVGKAKDFLTDERIDQVADKIKGVAPDSVDKHVDTLADKAKDANADDTNTGDANTGDANTDTSVPDRREQ